MQLSLYAALFTLLMLGSGCVHRWEVDGETNDDKEFAKSHPESIPEGLSVDRRGSHGNGFTFTNDTKETIYVVFKDSVIEADGKSYRVISGSQRLIHSDSDSPDEPIAPGSEADVSFYTDRDTLRKNNFIIGSDSPIDHADHLTFRVALRFGERKTNAVLVTSRRPPQFRTRPEHGGFCRQPTESEEKSATSTAREQYGPDVTVTYEGCALFINGGN